MNLRVLLGLALISSVLAADSGAAQSHQEIADVLDDFHDAAAHGDKVRYLGHLTDDAVFMGTDEWERWPKNPEFTAYVDGRFENGSGWEYRSVERQIRIADSGDTAWFDEVVYSELNGRFRGTGVLTRTPAGWKIAHYALSFLILNENWEQVIDLTRDTAAEQASPQASDRTAVLAAVKKFFETMTACDVEGARQVVNPDGRFFRLRMEGPGTDVSHFDNAGYFERLAACEQVNVERLWDAKVQVHRDLAMVWAPYEFWQNGEFSHCGVDLFNLVRGESGWQITGGAYTTETEGCEDSPLGPLVETRSERAGDAR